MAHLKTSSNLFASRFVFLIVVLGFAVSFSAAQVFAWPSWNGSSEKKKSATTSESAVADSLSNASETQAVNVKEVVTTEAKKSGGVALPKLSKNYATAGSTTVTAVPTGAKLNNIVSLPPKWTPVTVPVTPIKPIKTDYVFKLPQVYVKPIPDSVNNALKTIQIVKSVKKEQERQKKEALKKKKAEGTITPAEVLELAKLEAKAAAEKVAG